MGVRVGGWGRVGGGVRVAIYLKSNYVPETLSFSKICSESSFSRSKFFLTDGRTDGLTDRQTDGPTNLLIEAPFPELKSLVNILHFLPGLTKMALTRPILELDL